MDDLWKQYAADFRAMSDDEIDNESRDCQDRIDRDESWLEAVASWEAAGKLRDGEGGK